METLKRFIPGLRIIKTFIAVLLCLVLFNITGYGYPIHAAIACVLMMKATPEETIVMGRYRVIGTLLGALISLIALNVVSYLRIEVESLVMSFVIAFAVFFSFVLCKGLALNTSVASMSAIIIIILLMSVDKGGGGLFGYIATRTIETLIGILIAFLVNRFIIPSRGL